MTAPVPALVAGCEMCAVLADELRCDCGAAAFVVHRAPQPHRGLPVAHGYACQACRAAGRQWLHLAYEADVPETGRRG